MQESNEFDVPFSLLFSRHHSYDVYTGDLFDLNYCEDNLPVVKVNKIADPLYVNSNEFDSPSVALFNDELLRFIKEWKDSVEQPPSVVFFMIGNKNVDQINLCECLEDDGFSGDIFEETEMISDFNMKILTEKTMDVMKEHYHEILNVIERNEKTVHRLEKESDFHGIENLFWYYTHLNCNRQKAFFYLKKCSVKNKYYMRLLQQAYLGYNGYFNFGKYRQDEPLSNKLFIKLRPKRMQFFF